MAETIGLEKTRVGTPHPDRPGRAAAETEGGTVTAYDGTLEAIRRAAVGEVLRQMARGAAPGRTPLEQLEVVRRGLTAAGFTPTPRARRHELARLLQRLVEEELRHLRRLAGVCRPERDSASVEGSRDGAGYGPADLADGERPPLGRVAESSPAPAAYGATPFLLRARLRADFGQGHPVLEALSAIYHLYLRPDLGVTLDAFVTLLGDRHRRTVQRRLSRGVAILAERLRDRERAALLATRRERLSGRIPGPAPSLLGAADAVEALADVLMRGGPILLAGEAGAGKSVLARAAVARLLEQDALDELVWLETDPATVHVTALVEAARAGRAAGAPGRTTRALLVVDGLDAPCAARAAAEAAGALGLPSLLVGRATPAALGPSGGRLLRPPVLGARASRALLRRELLRLGESVDEGEWRGVLAATAGHPRALLRAAAAMRSRAAGVVARDFIEGRGPAGALYERMWSASWHDAPRGARESVRAVLALRRAGIVACAENVARLRGESAGVVGRGLEAALDAGLLAPSGEGGYLPGRFLRRWLGDPAPAIQERRARARHAPSG